MVAGGRTLSRLSFFGATGTEKGALLSWEKGRAAEEEEKKNPTAVSERVRSFSPAKPVKRGKKGKKNLKHRNHREESCEEKAVVADRDARRVAQEVSLGGEGGEKVSRRRNPLGGKSWSGA